MESIQLQLYKTKLSFNNSNAKLFHILDIPLDLWIIISQYLGYQSLFSLERTCRELSKIIDRNEIWIIKCRDENISFTSREFALGLETTDSLASDSDNPATSQCNQNPNPNPNPATSQCNQTLFTSHHQ